MPSPRLAVNRKGTRPIGSDVIAPIALPCTSTQTPSQRNYTDGPESALCNGPTGLVIASDLIVEPAW